MSEIPENPLPELTTAADYLGFDPDFLRDPYPTYGALRGHGPLFRTRAGLLVTTSHDLCSALLRDPLFGRGDDPLAKGEAKKPVDSFLLMDPPDHTRLRALVSRAFTPRMVERLRPRVEAISAQLVDSLPDQADLISDYAYPLPVLVITEMLGVPPEDHERFRGWSETLARSLDPMLSPELVEKTENARREFDDYFRALIARRRAEPGDDLLSGLTQVEELTEAELVATCVLLLVAGHETTVNLIANGVLALARHDKSDFLAKFPEKVGGVVEEVLRYDPPVQLTLRYALEDTELGGLPVPAGHGVLALIGAANRDPGAFDEPDRFDVDRGPGRHLAFGLGIHFCLGATLARLEGAIALTALAKVAPQLADPAPPYKENLVLRGLATLPVRLSR